MKLCCATNNKNKLLEIKEKLGSAYQIFSPEEIGIYEELPENQDTLEGNSLEKAQFVHRLSGIDCIADDTGLEVVALNGAPGVYSARFAGEAKSSEDNIHLLLQQMRGISDRRASFRTVITLILHNRSHQFEGRVSGTILEEPRGAKGFGYDPVFKPDGHEVSFAQMDLDLKNKISHRARAMEKLVRFLTYHGKD